MDLGLTSIDQAFLLRQTECLIRSYHQWTGKNLWNPTVSLEEAAQGLFNASFVLASSDTSSDPLLNYGNLAALKLWELPWQKFTQTPGRYTAEPMERAQRDKFLEEVKKNGFIENYSGIRISSTGKRFEIKKATVWNLMDQNHQYAGQAAMFNDWEYL